MTSIKTRLNSYAADVVVALNTVDSIQLEKAYTVIHKAHSFRDSVFVCGNGGSAAISDHFMCDHSKGVCSDTAFKPKVFSLASNMSLITAIANDFKYEDVFSKQIEMFAKPQDVLVAVSSSGNSPNIINAINTAKQLGMNTIALVGFDGGEVSKLSDIVLHIKSNNYGVVEDCHQSLMHILAQHLRVSNSTSDASLKL
jgi:phosphoheptose isomerase